MTLSLQMVFSLPMEPGESLFDFDFAASAGGRAVAVLSRQQGGAAVYQLARLGAEGCRRQVIDSALVAGHDPLQPFNRAVLCPVGTGFALVTRQAVALWPGHDTSVPLQLRIPDSFPRNALGFAAEVSGGALSDDPRAALVLLREPQMIMDVTRYALLRLDVDRGQCRWEWTREDGDPPWLSRQGLPAPALEEAVPGVPSLQARRPVLFHGRWLGGELRLFTVGLQGNYHRWGMDYALDARIHDGGRAEVSFVSDEQSYGTYSSSGNYLILNPLRTGTASKGASRLLDLRTGVLHAVKLPRGHARLQVADHAGDLFWLRARRGEPLRFVACTATES